MIVVIAGCRAEHQEQRSDAVPISFTTSCTTSVSSAHSEDNIFPIRCNEADAHLFTAVCSNHIIEHRSTSMPMHSSRTSLRRGRSPRSQGIFHFLVRIKAIRNNPASFNRAAAPKDDRQVVQAEAALIEGSPDRLEACIIVRWANGDHD